MADAEESEFLAHVEDMKYGDSMTLESVHLNSAMNVVLAFSGDRVFIVSAAGAKILRSELAGVIEEFDAEWRALK